MTGNIMSWIDLAGWTLWAVKEHINSEACNRDKGVDLSEMGF